MHKVKVNVKACVIFKHTMQPSYLKCSKALRKTEREPEKLSILMFFLSQTAINVSVKLKLGWNINDVFMDSFA